MKHTSSSPALMDLLEPSLETFEARVLGLLTTTRCGLSSRLPTRRSVLLATIVTINDACVAPAAASLPATLIGSPSLK